MGNYSFEWGQRVFGDLAKKYPRATYLLAAVSSQYETAAVKSLITGSNVWNVHRDMVRILESWLLATPPSSRTTTQMLSMLPLAVSYATRNRAIRPFEVLTALKLPTKIEEQSLSRGDAHESHRIGGDEEQGQGEDISLKVEETENGKQYLLPLG